MKNVYLLCLLLFPAFQAFGQFNQTNGSANTCSGVFYDSGGSFGTYANNENTVYTICSNAGNCVSVNFTAFDIENGWDNLYIYDGPTTASPLIGTYTGTTSPGSISSTSGCLTFRFTSDGSVAYSGWSANISCGTCGAGGSCLPNISNCTANTCSGNFYDSGGSSGTYGNNENFTQTICSNSGNCVSVNFTSFNLESCCDALTIYDGPTTSAPIIGVYTGTTLPGTISSTTGCLTFVFTSDGSITYSGWEASISCATCGSGGPSSCLPNMGNCLDSTCTGNFFDTGGNFGTYGNNENLVHTICSDAGDCVALNFTQLNLESCCDDITIYDGPNTSSPVIGTYTGSAAPGSIPSTTGCLTIAFSSDGSVTYDGWAASISCQPCGGATSCLPNMGNCLDNVCSGNFFDSGGNSSSYGNNESLVHTICSSSSNCVEVNFSSFNIEAGFDFLTVYDGGSTSTPVLGTYTGTTIPATITGTTGCLTFEFTSDGSVAGPGWEATINCTTCPAMSGCLIDPIANSHGLPPGFTQGCDDLCSSNSIPLGFTYDICGLAYSSMYVNMNGNITFGSSYTTFTPVGMPNNTTAVMVAPFWSDVDTRGCGTVYYENGLTNAIVTWYQVGYYSSNCDKTNTYQLILSDGFDPIIGLGNNTAFFYGDMQWTTGDVTGTGGFAGSAATAGVNANDGVNYSAIGRFDHAGNDYDGPDLTTDGVDYLDNRCFRFPAAGCSVLPFEFLKVEAVIREDRYVELQWSTNTDHNNTGFEVERSVDGVNFEPIGHVAGQGQRGIELVDYSHDDRDVARNRDYWYRLKQLDANGNHSYSPVVNARITDEKALVGKAYPNPMDNSVSVGITPKVAGTCMVKFLNGLGQVVHAEQHEVQRGSQTLTFDTDMLPSGMYFMHIAVDGEEVSVQKVSK